MPYIKCIPPEEGTDLFRQLCEADMKTYGHVPEHTQVFSLRPDVLAAWRELVRAVRSHSRLRRYELITVAAAVAMDCST